MAGRLWLPRISYRCLGKRRTMASQDSLLPLKEIQSDLNVVALASRRLLGNLIQSKGRALAIQSGSVVHAFLAGRFLIMVLEDA